MNVQTRDRPSDVGGLPEPARPRVLVVDDDERNLLAVQSVLEEVGELVLARSGEEALRHLLRGEFAVILLDVYMPGMDGYETAQMIRQREQSKRIPIIFLSAVNKEAEHLMRGYAMGAVDYVFKPVDPVILRSKVAVFVDLFAKNCEIERKARAEQALLDANLRANAELLQAEQELRRAEERQAAIIQSLPIVLYLEPLQCEARCPHFVSGNFEAITGYSFADVLEQPGLWAERIHPEDRRRVLDALDERERTGRLSVEYRWKISDGTYRHFHDQAVLLHDASGGRLEYAGTLTDVSERRDLESQLLQAQKMDAIGKLTGGIAHDFNNLLAAVLGGLGLIERRANLADEHRKILAMTKRAADQGTELVGRLLAFARKQQLEPAPIDLGTLHRNLSDLMRHTLGGRVELEWDFSHAECHAYADASQLELALMNLIINARDATTGSGVIRISAEPRAIGHGNDVKLAPGDYVIFSVTDEGTGIPAELIDKVMEPFFSTKEVGKGTGLGLSMVYGFAQQSGGTFVLKSKVGEGTCAEIWLPQGPFAASADPSDSATEEIELAAAEPLNILLVDDHPEVRVATSGMLTDLGHKVIEADSGAEALACIEADKGEIDVLVSDFAMPHLSGSDVIRRARELRPDLPALLITGYADQAEIGDRPERVPVLSKPFQLTELARVMRDLGRQAKRRTEAQGA